MDRALSVRTRPGTIGAMWTAYLELLARDAPAVEYEAPVLTARANGEPPEVIAQLEEGKRLALQVRESLLTKARREDERRARLAARRASAALPESAPA